MSARRRLPRPDAVTLAVLAIAAVALAFRLWDLGAKALHHDESLHATFSWYFQHNRPLYKHDPLMHGPFQFHAMAAFFKLFGDGDFMARVPAAIAGSALVATPLLLRRWLGGPGTLLAALFLAASPSLLYYSRFAREDIYIALWTVLLFAAVWRYRQEGRDRWLALTAAALALAFATKESVYLTAAVALLYLDIALARALVEQAGAPLRERLWRTLLLAPVAWLVAAFWVPLARWRERRGYTRFPREAAPLIVIGALTLPQLAAAVQIPITALGGSVAGESERRLGVMTVSLLLGAATIVGLYWDWRRWLLVAGIFYGITIPLFTTGFTNLELVGLPRDTPGGLTSDFWGALDYWLAQQDVRRGEQPVFYYVMMLPLYEFLTLLPALALGGWLALRRRDGFATLLLWWFAGSFVALTYAGEKMPWLVVHLALPLALLAACGLGAIAPAAGRALRRGGAPARAWAGAAAATLVAAALVALSLRTAHGVTYLHPDTPVEPLIYTQTSPDVPRLARAIRERAEQVPGRRLPILVDDSQALSWPWAWYLRDLPAAGYAGPAAFGAVAPGTLVIALPTTLAQYPQLREQAAEARPYHHRWWFPEEGYRATTLRGFVDGLFTGRLIEDWVEFTRRRIPPAVPPLGSLDAEVLFPQAPSAASKG